MKIPFLLLSVLFLAFAGCKNSNPTTPPASKEETKDEPAPTANNCLPPKVGDIPESNTLLSVEPSIKENCLVFQVTYSGGCQEHDFNIFWG